MAIKTWRRYNKDILLTVLGVVVIVLVVLLAFKNNGSNNSQQTSTDKTQVPNVAIAPSGMKYPAGWREVSQIAVADKQAGVVSEAVHINPDAQVIVRIDEGKLAKDFDINKTLGETVNKLQGDLKDFTLISKNIVRLGVNQAMIITYQDLNSEQMYKHTQVIVPTTNKSYFLTLTAKVSDFKQITDYAKIQDSLTKYIN